jgi:HEAT repeat protein
MSNASYKMFMKKGALPLGILAFGLFIAGSSWYIRQVIQSKYTTFRSSLVYDIQSDNALLRARAARYPDFFIKKGQVDDFFRLTVDSDLYVRTTAINMLVNNISMVDETYLLGKLRAGTVEEQKNASLLLLFKENAIGISSVLQNLPLTNEVLMEELLKQLSHFDLPEVKDSLLTLVQDPANKTYQVYAAWALGKLKAKETIPTLQTVMNGTSENAVKLATRYAIEVQMSDDKE